MSYKDITAGEKTATPKAARFITSKSGKLGMEISFEFQEQSTDTPERINWVGWLTEAAMERTMDTLVNVLGYNGNDDVGTDGCLTDPNALAYNKQVKLVLEEEAYTDKDGNQRISVKVKWVNRLGGSGFASVRPESVKHDLNAIGFKAAFLAAKQASGQSAAPAAPKPMTDGAVPF